MRNFRFLKQFVCIALVFTLCFAFFGQSSKTIIKTEAKTIAEYEAEIKRLQEQKKATDAKIKETRGDVAKEKENQAAITKQISNTQQLMAALEAKIKKLDSEIAITQEKLNQQEAAIKKGIADFELRLRAMYLSGNDSVASILLGSTDFYDMLMKLELCKRVAKHDNDTIDNLIKMKNEIQTTKADLEAKKADQLASKNEFSTNLKELNALSAESKDAIQDLKDQEAAYSAQSAALRKKQEAAQDAVDRLMAERNSSMGKYVGGEFTWPVPGYYRITSYFGEKDYSIRTKPHTGIDIASSGIFGKPIVASNAGIVVDAKYSSYGYGNHITIDHGGGYQSLYGHCTSLAVSAGQYVKKGQVIGYVGSTGLSTGPHLHFGIMKDGSWVNPRNYFTYIG